MTPKGFAGVHEVLVGMDHANPLVKAIRVSFYCLLVLILSFHRQQRAQLLTPVIKELMEFN